MPTRRFGEVDETEGMIQSLSRRLEAQEKRFRSLTNDDSIANLLAGGINWLGPSAIGIDELSALAVNTGALTISDVLTIGPSGRIEDAQGSIWDESGITLQLATAVTEGIHFRRTGDNVEADLLGYIDGDTDGSLGILISNGLSFPNEDSAAIIAGIGTLAESFVQIRASESGGGNAMIELLSDSQINLEAGANSSVFDANGLTIDGYVSATYLRIADSITDPGTTAGVAKLYIDSADGDLKVRFGDGSEVLIAANP